MRAVQVEYHAPARFDDLIEVVRPRRRIGRTSITYECAAYRLADDELMVTATQTLVLVDLASPPPSDPRALREPVRGSRARTSRSEHRALEAVDRILDAAATPTTCSAPWWRRWRRSRRSPGRVSVSRRAAAELGPQAGTPDEARRARSRSPYQATRRRARASTATPTARSSNGWPLVSAHVLLGWDTGGEALGAIGCSRLADLRISRQGPVSASACAESAAAEQRTLLQGSSRARIRSADP